MGEVKKGRTTVYNNICDEDKMSQVNPENLQLENDFIEYLESVDRAKSTIKQYRSILHVFWCWNLEFNNNKFFVDLTKREIAKFQNHALNVWGWSSNRIRTVKAALSSLSNYISDILDDEFEDYRPIVRKIESPVKEPVREKMIYTEEELHQILDTLVEREEYMKACVLALAMYSGKRKAELTRFKVSYFDKENLICEGALYKTPEKMVSKGRGKKGKLIDVYILAKPFQPYLDMWLKKREELGIDSEWLFPKYKDGKWLDEHIEISTLNSYANTYSKISGRNFHMHLLRHWNTTYLLEQNIPDSVVQAIHQWSSADLVRVYDDRTADSQFEKYFGVEGIKQVEQKNLGDLG